MLLTPSPSVGASGAIFGLIGAEGVFLYRDRRLLGERGRRGLQNIIFIIILNFAIGLQAQFIDSGAHLGGLIGGALLGWLIGPVWGFLAEPTLGGEVMLGDQHPLTGARWLAAAAAAAGLATLTGIAIAFPR
jgi:rhomboid protease GluP